MTPEELKQRLLPVVQGPGRGLAGDGSGAGRVSRRRRLAHCLLMAASCLLAGMTFLCLAPVVAVLNLLFLMAGLCLAESRPSALQDQEGRLIRTFVAYILDGGALIWGSLPWLQQALLIAFKAPGT